MCYSCSLDLYGDTAKTLNNLSELEDAFSLAREVERKMQIDHGGMCIESSENLRGNLALPGNLEGLGDVRVRWAEIQRHMIFGLYIRKHHSSKHISSFRLGSDDLAEKVVPICPCSRNADY